MTIRRIIAASFFVFCFSANANQTYTTQKGFVFTRINDEKFGDTFMAPDDLIWSQYQGTFSNVGKMGDKPVNAHGDHEIMDSLAVQACKAIGGNLPSVMQYRDFLNYFQTTADFQSIFPITQQASPLAWTSTGLNEAFVRFVKIAPVLDGYGDVIRSSRELSVFCIRSL